MKNLSSYLVASMATILLFFLSGNIQAQGVSSEIIATLTDVQKYYRAIHIMAMLLLGFGFLMVFVRKYGRSALTATFLLVSISIPLYYLIGGSNINHRNSGAASLLMWQGIKLAYKIFSSLTCSFIYSICG